ncbi:MAG: hypothetical protein BAJALOKI3v1_290039 [Promethearchaeota archaeon]|nr:MAG: hypothetical protein BAJALOKI3v1_290039 [Candidatus Lokiarchaeota archaeon]
MGSKKRVKVVKKGQKTDIKRDVNIIRRDGSKLIIDECYNVFLGDNYTLSELENNKDNIISKVLRNAGYPLTDYNIKHVIKHYKGIYYLLSPEYNFDQLKEVMDASGLTYHILKRIYTQLEEEYNCKFDFNTNKTLDDHKKDIEPIVRNKEGKIIQEEWRRNGRRKRPYFQIECDKGHKWWALKGNIKKGSWCQSCLNMDLDDHRKEIEPIVRNKGGEIMQAEWRFTGANNHKKPYFLIKCEEAHDWWSHKDNIKSGSWCPTCFRKDLQQHQTDIEPIVKKKGGKILRSEWRYKGEKNNRVPYFLIECEVGHKWWAAKTSIVPNRCNPSGSWCPFCGDLVKAVGLLAHPLLEYFSINYFRFFNCSINHEDVLSNDRRSDLFIHVELNFKKYIEANQELIVFPKEIRFITIDFTFSLTPSVIIDKFHKNYHSESRYLIIVLLREDDWVNVERIKFLLNSDQNLTEQDKRRITIFNLKEYFVFLDLNKIVNILCNEGQLNIENYNTWNSRNKFKREITLKFLKIIKLCYSILEGCEEDLNDLVRLSTLYSKKLKEEN